MRAAGQPRKSAAITARTTQSQGQLIGGGRNGGDAEGSGVVEIEDAGNEVADGAAEMSPEALLEGGVILGAAEKIADQLAKNGVALQELHHAGGRGAAQERAAIKTANDARSEFEFTGESGFDPRRIFFGATLGEGAAEKLARAHRVKKTFASEGIDPGGGVANERPIPADHAAMGKGALLRRRQYVAITFW